MAVLRNFPALIFGILCLLVAGTFYKHILLSYLVITWAIGLIGMSLFYEKQPGWILHILSLMAAVLLLVSMSDKPVEILVWVSMFIWFITQLILTIGAGIKKRSAWSLMFITVFATVGVQMIPHLPESVSKIDVGFLILFLVSLMPTIFSIFTTSNLKMRWEVLGLQTLLARVAWVLYGQLALPNVVSVIDFRAFLMTAIVLLMLFSVQTKWRVPASMQLQTGLTLFIALLSLDAPIELSKLLLLLIVPLSLSFIVGPQIILKESKWTDVFIKIDCGALGSPLALAVLIMSGYMQANSFPYTFVSVAALLVLAAQPWRERGPELQIANEIQEARRIKQLSRYFFQVCALAIVVFECIRMAM